jgi:hypothetical protein
MNLSRKLSSLLRLIKSLSQVNEAANRLDRVFNLHKAQFVHELLRSDGRLSDPRCLNRFESQLFSQSGQDGILSEIFRRLGVTSGTFVEFGVGAGDGFETNTTALLLEGWQGLWIEASDEACDVMGRNFAAVIQQKRLQIKQAFVTADNIATLLSEAKIPAHIDLLSIDIDGNDLWVWKALRDFKPKCVVIEYNSYIPMHLDWTMPYNESYVWDGSIEFGASSKALARVGAEMGYNLVGCDTTGSDCFFVRKDLCADLFAGPFTAEQWHHPMRYFLINRPGYPRRLRVPFSATGSGRNSDGQ